MRLRKLYKNAAIAATALLASCMAEENTPLSGLGFVKFEVSVDGHELAPSNGSFALTMATADGSESHTWPSLSDVPLIENYHVGEYTATAVSGDPTAEGYGCPCYAGTKNFEIVEAQYTTVNIVCTLQQAIINTNVGKALLAAYPGAKVQVHSSGHAYVDVIAHEELPLLIAPGSTSIYVTLPQPSGDGTVTVAPDFSVETFANEAYDITIDLDDEGALIVNCGTKTAKMHLGASLFNSEPPTITASGFEPGTPLMLFEGYPASSAVSMTVDAPAGLKAVMLTVGASLGASIGFPPDADLLHPSPEVLSSPLAINKISDTKFLVDFTKLLEDLSVATTTDFSLMLLGRDRLGRVSEPMVLDVNICSVDFGIVSQTPAVVGENIASVTLALNVERVEAADFSVHVTDATCQPIYETPIIASKIDQDKKLITLSFAVHEGKDPVPFSISYMGDAKVHGMAEREVKPYQIAVDAYALSAIVNIHADDAATTKAIASMATVWANGREMAIDARYPESGIIRIVGLQPGTSYNVSVKVVDGSFEPSTKVSTETATQLPDSDFEDFDVDFTYNKLPQGGVYSATAFPVYNIQNYADISVSWVRKYWTSVNDKTFCREAKHHNTWYMQPSSMIDFTRCVGGSKSIMIQSVGWDLNGPEIEPSVQQGSAYQPYNTNVPQIAHSSAGRLFLGSYKFDPATGVEQYDEGIAFASRPSSLNGFYRYIPDELDYTDQGLVRVELINDVDGPKPVTIAVAEMKFSSSPDFVAFNLPIKYDVIGLKATKIRVMFSSSSRCGSIQDEDMMVPVTPRVEQSASIGSRLWIDNLSLSYSY